MITCEDIRELAQFQYNDDDKCVLSFYFQPRRPQNKSHREEAILAKDLVREALHGTEKNGKNKCARADLQRILDLAARNGERLEWGCYVAAIPARPTDRRPPDPPFDHRTGLRSRPGPTRAPSRTKRQWPNSSAGRQPVKVNGR